MGIFSRKGRQERSHSPMVLVLSQGGSDYVLSGYHALTDAPPVAASVWRISDMISSMTIHLMENRADGDIRVRDAMAKKVDVEPWSLATRKTWMGWIVTKMLLEGEAFILPMTEGGQLKELWPMAGAKSREAQDGLGYLVDWKGHTFGPDEILHFRLRPDPGKPWKGLGPDFQLQGIVDSIVQTNTTKTAYMSSEYKPPLIIAVNADSDLADEDKREKFLKKYIKRKSNDEPWVIPADMMNIQQIKPLSLTDLAIKDGTELDMKAVASLFGVPGFMVGVGTYNKDEYNTFIQSVLLPICKAIEQELTKKLLLNDRRYFRFNSRALYAYDLKTLSEIADNQYVRGLMTGNECRDWINMPPKPGLNELVMLENYIPADMIGNQKKLISDKEDNDGAEA